MLPLDSMEDVQQRIQATILEIKKENCNADAETKDKERFYGWLPQPAEGVTPGAPVSKAKTYGVLAEAFVPNQPDAKGPNDGLFKWFCCCHVDCTAVYLGKKGAGSTSMHEHLRDTHDVKADMTKGRGLESCENSRTGAVQIRALFACTERTCQKARTCRTLCVLKYCSMVKFSPIVPSPPPSSIHRGDQS